MAAIPPSLLQMFGPIETLLTDPTVRRILVDAPDAILVERHGRLERTPLGYSPAALEASLDALARRAGKPFDAAHPSLEAQLKDGTRFLALRPPASERGSVLVILRPGGRLTDLEALTRQGALTPAAAVTLGAALRAGLNMAVVGPADSGRTTMLEALAACLAEGSRIGVVEEHPELRMPGRDLMRLQTRKPEKDGSGGVTTGDLLYFAGRMSVDRLVLGDLKWQDASDCIHLLAGRLCPVLMALPGLTSEDALARLEALARASATGGKERAVGGLLQAGLDIVVTLGRVDGNRVVFAIEHVGPGGDRARLTPLYTRRAQSGFELEPSDVVAELTGRWSASQAPSTTGDEGDRETLGYLPAIPLMTESHRLPEEARPPASPPPQSLTAAVVETPRVPLAAQSTPARAPLPVPKGATVEASFDVLPEPPAPSGASSSPNSGGDPLATDNMFATLRPGPPGEAGDPLRRLLQGLRSEPPAAPVETVGTAPLASPADDPGVPPTIEGPVPVGPGADEDEERTMVSEAVSTATSRDEADSKPNKTFSQVLRNLGVGPGESQEISGAWTGMNVVAARASQAPAATPADAELMDQTRESDSPVAERTTRVHASDD